MRNRHLPIQLALFMVTLVFLGCGSSSSSSSDSDTGGGGGTVVISGTLGTGTIARHNWVEKLWLAAARSITPPVAALVDDEYTIVAIDNETQKTYTATANAGEAFSLELPEDGSYVVSIINDGSYVGPVVFDSTDTESKTAIAPDADTELGDITVDTTSGYAAPESPPDCVDDTVTAVASGGKPLGAGNDGKTLIAGDTSDSDADKDKDGIPNLFDADEDNDGFRNGIISMPSGSAVESDVVETVYMSSNIWADHDTTDGAEELIALRLHLVPISGQENLIASVACIGVPATIQDVATVRWAGSLGDPDGYPTENSLWQDAGFGLYKTTTLTPEEWIVSICPHAIMAVGDTFTIRVTYADASHEDFFITMAYVLTDWAKLASYNGTSMPTAEGVKTNPITYDSDTLAIVINKPRDEDDNVLAGLTYSVRYGLSDCSGGSCSVPTSCTEDPITDSGGDTLTYTITTTTPGTYYVTPVAESADGQRNGEETWFTRQ